jgi:hypothetical protein
VAATFALLAAVPAMAAGDSVVRQGPCSGAGQWRIRAGRQSATTIKVRFDIKHVAPGDSWQLFLSDDGVRIYAGSRVADSSGELHVVKVTTDRPGIDRVKGSGVNAVSAGSCVGAVSF